MALGDPISRGPLQPQPFCELGLILWGPESFCDGCIGLSQGETSAALGFDGRRPTGCGEVLGEGVVPALRLALAATSYCHQVPMQDKVNPSCAG